jgi:hypothetical protein
VTVTTRPAAPRAGLLVVALLVALIGRVEPVPATAAAADPVILGAGDIANCEESAGAQATAAILDRTPGIVFTLGDNVYVDGTPAEFARCYAPDWGRHKARTRFAVAGNHDYNTPGAAGHYGYFGAAAGDPARGYYDATVGAWHVVVLNSNCEEVGGCGAGSPQERWLRGVLAASDARCTIALWHHPSFSSATVHRAFPTWQPFWQALYDYGAEAVLVASDHVYERFGPQTPTGAFDPQYGLRQFTVGTGGRSHQLFRTALPNSEVRNGGTYGVISLTLHDSGYDWRFLPEAGQTFTDSGSAPCHGAPPAPRPGHGPITEVGSSSDASATGGTITLGRPAGTRAGQVMVASVVSSAGGAGLTAPDGWSVVRDDAIPGTLRQTVYLKVAGAAEPESYTWRLGSRDRLAGGLTAYAGVDPVEPLDAVAAAVRPVAGTDVGTPSISTAAPDARLIQLAAVNAEGTVLPPEGMAQRWLAAAPGGDARDALASAFDATLPAGGPTGPRTAQATEAGPRIGVLLALRPAP